MNIKQKKSIFLPFRSFYSICIGPFGYTLFSHYSDVLFSMYTYLSSLPLSLSQNIHLTDHITYLVSWDLDRF